MAKTRIHAAKYALWNLECGECSTGVVQVHKQWIKSEGGTVTTVINGCLDCGHEYGLRQAQDLKPYTRDDITWP